MLTSCLFQGDGSRAISAFWINPFAVGFDEMCVSDLLLVDVDGNVLEGGKPGEGQICEAVSCWLCKVRRADVRDNSAGYAIHGTIHRTRQDIHAAAHSHTAFGRAFSVLGRNIDMASHGA